MCMNNQKFSNISQRRADEWIVYVPSSVSINMIKIEPNRDNWDQFQMMKYVNERIAEILYINNERAVIRSDYIDVRWLYVYFFFFLLFYSSFTLFHLYNAAILYMMAYNRMNNYLKSLKLRHTNYTINWMQKVS